MILELNYHMVFNLFIRRGSGVMKFILVLFLLFVSVFISDIEAQNLRYNYVNPLSAKFILGIECGVSYTRSDFRNSDFDWLTRLSAEYNLTSRNPFSLGLKAYGGYGYLAGSGGATFRVPQAESFSNEIIYLGISPVLNYALSNNIIPYVSVGLSYLHINPELRDIDGNAFSYNNRFSPHSFNLHGEGGFRFLVSDDIGFNISGGVHYGKNDNLDDIPNSISNGTDNDIHFFITGGISFYFGGLRDSDGDGIPDISDACPDTPAGVLVDQFGCPVDTDRDGVPDYLDLCPNTPVNIPVDENGCPSDADGDGVPDYKDLCPDTPAGVPVDERGCPFDSDGDGVPDYRDLCPGTPIGVEVDKWGCEIKEKVSTILPETKFNLSGNLNFETGKAILLPHANAELDRMLAVMREYPDTKWRIEGHTDNTGSYSTNKQLSFDRARAVYNYFVAGGIERYRLQMSGSGPDNPIADNSTEAGRSLNRRVSIVLIDDKTNFAFTPGITDISDYRYNASNEKNIGDMVFTDGMVYTVQISSWRERSKADTEAAKLREAGYKAFVIEANLPELDGRWYRVRVGHFDSIAEARRVSQILK